MARGADGGAATASRLTLCYASHVHTASPRLRHVAYCTQLAGHGGDCRAVVTDLTARDEHGKVPLVRPTYTITWRQA